MKMKSKDVEDFLYQNKEFLNVFPALVFLSFFGNLRLWFLISGFLSKICVGLLF